jgi:hypothetical protein
MKKAILGLSLLAFVASTSFAGDKDKGKLCTDKEKAAATKGNHKCCADMIKEAKAEAKTVKKVVKKAA